MMCRTAAPPMATRPIRSISGPIIWGSVSATLTVVMLVGWVYVILRNQELTQQWVANFWLLVGGILSLVAITTVLILFSVFLARQVLEIRRQTTFIDSVTHELRSPLASIRLGLQTLGRDGLADTQREGLRNMMLDDTERLSAFIDDILETTRLEYHRAGHLISTVPLRELAERCAGAVARRHKTDPDNIVIDIAAEIELRTDATALETVLKNLLDNAIKYSNDPIKVELNAAINEDGRVHIDVTDHGVGIPPRDLNRIFDRFYRVDQEAVRARRGTGLGLFVVKALVKDMGGKLRAHSEGPELGTRISIVLPTRRRGDASRASSEPEGTE